MDNAKEFHSEEMLVFFRENGIIIQPVVTYNTVMYRVESYISVVKSHGRVDMLMLMSPCAPMIVFNLPLTIYEKNVCISFGSRITSPIPCEHTLVRDSSFVDRYVEGIYVHTAITGPVIHIFDMHRKQEIVVKDFTSYPSEFLFKDPSCLTLPGYSATEIEKMHQEDHRWCRTSL